MSADTLPSPTIDRTRVDSGAAQPASWVLAGGLLLAHVPLLLAYGHQLWLREHYQFFPLVLIGFFYLAWSRALTLGPLSRGNSVLGSFLLSVGLLVLLAAVYSGSPWMGIVSALWSGITVTYVVGGTRLLRAWFAPALLLAFVVYPPYGLDQILIGELQALVSRWGSHMLDVFGVSHVMTGNVVQLADKRLFVDEACSGINSLFSTLAFTLFFCLWLRRHWLHGLVLLAAAVVWVIGMNVMRVALIAYCQDAWDLDLLEGWRHDAVGVCMFVLCLVMVWSTDRFLLFLSATGHLVRLQTQAEQLPTSPEPEPEPARTVWPKPVFGMIPMCLIVLPFMLLGFSSGWSKQIWPTTRVTQLPISNTVLPRTLDGWNQIEPMLLKSRSHGGVYGDFSHMWIYERGRLRAQLSLDYGFSGWHELTGCYMHLDWNVQNRIVHEPETGRVPYVEVELRKGFHERGYLLFALIDSTGKWLKPEPFDVGARFRDKFFRDRYTNTCYQVQVFVDHSLPLTEPERVDLQVLLQDLARTFATELARQKKVVQQ